MLFTMCLALRGLKWKTIKIYASIGSAPLPPGQGCRGEFLEQCLAMVLTYVAWDKEGNLHQANKGMPAYHTNHPPTNVAGNTPISSL